MDQSKTISKRLFWVIFIIGLVVAAFIASGMYWSLDQELLKITESGKIDPITDMIAALLNAFKADNLFFFKIIVPAIVGTCILLSLCCWAIVRFAIAGPLKTLEASEPQEATRHPSRKKKDFVDQKIELEKKQRLFLHTLSILQREGRMLDFLSEDLSLYSDDQIGAAVRSIQEDSKKAIKKYINPVPVIEKEEGQPVTIEKGFDIDSIKLIGNVAGEPPFEGIVRHQGWKAGRKDLPKLTQVQDPTVMAPAEIEIQ